MTHWIADSQTLWKSPLTDVHLYTAAAYYSLIAKMNVGMAATAVAVITIGFMAIMLSALDGEAGNLMFDGASICQYLLFIFFSCALADKTCGFSPLWQRIRSLPLLCPPRSIQVRQHHTICNKSSSIPSGFASANNRTRFVQPYLRSRTDRSHHSSSNTILG